MPLNTNRRPSSFMPFLGPGVRPEPMRTSQEVTPPGMSQPATPAFFAGGGQSPSFLPPPPDETVAPEIDPEDYVDKDGKMNFAMLVAGLTGAIMGGGVGTAVAAGAAGFLGGAAKGREQYEKKAERAAERRRIMNKDAFQRSLSAAKDLFIINPDSGARAMATLFNKVLPPGQEVDWQDLLAEHRAEKEQKKLNETEKKYERLMKAGQWKEALRVYRNEFYPALMGGPMPDKQFEVVESHFEKVAEERGIDFEAKELRLDILKLQRAGERERQEVEKRGGFKREEDKLNYARSHLIRDAAILAAGSNSDLAGEIQTINAEYERKMKGLASNSAEYQMLEKERGERVMQALSESGQTVPKPEDFRKVYDNAVENKPWMVTSLNTNAVWGFNEIFSFDAKGGVKAPKGQAREAQIKSLMEAAKKRLSAENKPIPDDATLRAAVEKRLEQQEGR